MGGLYKMGVWDAMRFLHRNSLTVLNYHRVDNYSRPDFQTYKSNVSATPELFALQMEYVKRHYHVISCGELFAALRDGKDLPPYPAIISFDDGYHDNLAHAYPILKRYGLPATIFLATGYIGKNIPFYWDYVAYCFSQTTSNSIPLSAHETVFWYDDVSRNKAVSRWINSVKQMPDAEKQARVNSLADILDVSVPGDAFAGLCLTWDQIREMRQNGIEFGAHTVHHPILTRVSLAEAEAELVDSKRKVEAELGEGVISFAYPNGGTSDYSAAIVELVRRTGFGLAFTLVPGPMRNSVVRKKPLTIQRIYLGNTDVLPRFAAKLVGMERLAGLLTLLRRR